MQCACMKFTGKPKTLQITYNVIFWILSMSLAKKHSYVIFLTDDLGDDSRFMAPAMRIVNC